MACIMHTRRWARSPPFALLLNILFLYHIFHSKAHPTHPVSISLAASDFGANATSLSLRSSTGPGLYTCAYAGSSGACKYLPNIALNQCSPRVLTYDSCVGPDQGLLCDIYLNEDCKVDQMVYGKLERSLKWSRNNLAKAVWCLLFSSRS